MVICCLDLNTTIKVIEVHMPVDGRIVCLNDIDRLIQQKLLFKYPETTGWLAKIRISKPFIRKGLMDSEKGNLDLKPIAGLI